MLLTAAMSLAGYTADAQEDSLWQDTCAHLRTELSSPYLRAAFAFLTSTSLVGNDFEVRLSLTSESQTGDRLSLTQNTYP